MMIARMKFDVLIFLFLNKERNCGNISEEMSSRLKAETVKSFRFPKIVKSEMIANQNGYCIFYPIIPAATMGGFAIGEELREFEICYRPNSKKLHNVFLDKILGYIPSKTKELDYMEYFAKTLEDEQMLLNEEKCLELYSVLEGNTKSFAMNGGETYIFKKDRHL